MMADVLMKDARYERGAMILTSNRGFPRMGRGLRRSCRRHRADRLLHHAVVIQIEGSSYRLRQHADLMPEHVRSKALINAPIPAPPPRRRGWPPKNPLGRCHVGNELAIPRRRPAMAEPNHPVVVARALPYRAILWPALRVLD